MNKVSRGVVASVLAVTTSALPAQEDDAGPQPTTPGVAMQQLAADLWRELGDADGNFTLSPASIAVALAMTATGARGDTQAELLRFLHVDAATDLAAVGALGARFEEGGNGNGNGNGKGPRVSIANRLFGARGFPFQRPFQDLVAKSFGAPLEPLDFAGAPEAARQHINAWVLGETADRIRDLLPPRSIGTDTRIVLVNAVHFLGDWAQPFTKESTRGAPFRVNATRTVQVPTMVATGPRQCFADGGHEFVQLPYAGGEFAMLFVLPPEGAAPETWVTKEMLAAPAEWPLERVTLWLPRCRIEMAETLRLRDTLRALGVKLLFDPRSCDLTGIADPPAAGDRLFVDEVYHKTFVRVDEKGTEAAAATAVAGKRGGAAPKPAREVRFDRPFWFVLRHLPTGAPLFVGKVVEPSDER